MRLLQLSKRKIKGNSLRYFKCISLISPSEIHVDSPLETTIGLIPFGGDARVEKLFKSIKNLNIYL